MAERAPSQRFVHSVGTRLALATALLVLLVACALYYALMRYERQGQLQAKRDAAAMVATLFAELSSAPVLFADEQGIRDSLGYLRSNEEVLEAAVFARKPDGMLDRTLGTMVQRPGARPSLRAPSPSEVGSLQQHADALDVSQWVKDPVGQPIAAVAVRFSLARENRSFALLERRTLQISLGLACGLTLLLLLLARVYIISPLRSVHAAVRALSGGAHPSRTLTEQSELPLTARDEIGDLARGFVAMAGAIERREAAIARQNDEMRLVLESVGEGFLVLDAHGVIEGQHSAVLETWFGNVPTGQALWSYLRPHDAQQAEWLELSWSNLGSPSMPLELCVLQMPVSFVAGQKHYLVQYRPVLAADGQLQKMVLVIADVTELRQREQAESEQRELVAVFAAVIRDRTGFVSFCEDAATLMKSIADPKSRERYGMLEHLHTLKGNAALFQLSELAAVCEEIELLCSAEKRLPGGAEAEQLAAAFAKSVRAVEPFIMLDRGHSVLLSDSDYARIERALIAGAPSAEVLMLLTQATAEPAELVFGRFGERLQVLARRLGKSPLRVLCEGHGVRFPKQKFAPLWSVMVHVLRNVADHGLETAWEREQVGKPAESSVSLRARLVDSRLQIEIRDDGRGVDWPQVRVRAERQGLAAETRAELVAALLGHGFSTLNENSVLSGRGVGLAAVQSEVKALDGTLLLDSEPGQGTTLTLDLPASLLA